MAPQASRIGPLSARARLPERAPAARPDHVPHLAGTPCSPPRPSDEPSDQPEFFSVGREDALDLRVRGLGPDDAAAFQALRLEGLVRHPCAFAASHDEEVGQSLAEVAGRLERQPVFGAFDRAGLVGMAGFAVPPLAKKRHKGVLWGVYVREEARGRGVGRALVLAVIEHARAQVVQLHAAVVTSNEAARALYRSLGFATYGVEPRGLFCAGQYFDQELMLLMLDDARQSRRGSPRSGEFAFDLGEQTRGGALNQEIGTPS